MNMKLFNQALSNEDLKAIKKGMAKNAIPFRYLRTSWFQSDRSDHPYDGIQRWYH